MVAAALSMPTAAEFSWATAPLNDFRAPVLASAGYVLVVLVLERLMRLRGRGFETKYLQAVHNAILCVLSLTMAVGTAVEVFRRIATSDGGDSVLGSARWVFCEDPRTQARGPLWYWSYLYYLSKYYELLDTVLQLLKGRPPPHFFLHVYHHATVLVMAWFWLEYAQSLQFIGLLFNTSVHVVMYYYYFRRVLGWPVWWKRYVTTFQIVQFGTSACVGMVTLAMLASGTDCAGPRVLMFNFIFNMTLMYQFFGVLGGGGKPKGPEGAKRL